jgi:hypothetical protein
MNATALIQFAYLNSIPYRLIVVLLLLFFAVLFLQSGLDKITDRKGNLEWLVGHFSKSMFANKVPFLLSVLTAMEMISGISSLIMAVLMMFLSLNTVILSIAYGVVAFCAITFLALFTGQRIAKDYAGAAGIVPYFLAAILAMIFIFAGAIQVQA